MEYNSAVARFHNFITQFKAYEDYLDSKVTPVDLFYLKSRELARQLVELGHKGTVLSREEFEEKKAAVQAAEAARSNSLTLASAGKELKDNFLKALAEREEANRSGKMTVNVFQTTFAHVLKLHLSSVIFIRDHNTLGQEVSGYIDYAHRLKTQDFEPYFSGKKRLMPGRSDLCYYNWKTQVSTSNSSPNFQVIYDDPNGLLFKNKRDKKLLNVDPSAGPGEDSKRTFLQSDLYVHVVIYDQNVRTV
ncbi:cilia- and flagella-associated protein 299 isoform X2 [Echeneis naucrates]|uniref:cilia- and flagella-associated protein 299 isoform X2 n=1 Tax=Echeneis naucrates TaxID=173247 RepID=UPI001113B584|nr:cilia- and flagella-associated protein 299 isoform X2 [Echeneis naucrates]